MNGHISGGARREVRAQCQCGDAGVEETHIKWLKRGLIRLQVIPAVEADAAHPTNSAVTPTTEGARDE